MNSLESGRSVAGQEAIDYLETIWNTHTDAAHGDFGSSLSGLAALVALEEAHLHWLATQDFPQNPIVISINGFPSLPTLMADAKAAVERHEALKRSHQQTTLDILADFSNMNEQALRKHASERAKKLVSPANGFINMLGKIHPQDLDRAHSMVNNYQTKNKKPEGGQSWVAAETATLLTVQVYNDKRPGRPHGFKFIPIDSSEQTKHPSHPFFMIFTLYDRGEIAGGGHEISPYDLREDTGWIKTLNYNMINWNVLNHSIRNTLLTYDGFRYKKSTIHAFDALMTASAGLQSLTTISKTQAGLSKHEDAMKAQEQLAQALSQIQTLPPELFALISAAIKDAARDTQTNLPATGK